MSASAEGVRSWLFAPADHPRRCEKALRAGADQVIWDLEDAVGAADKEAARQSVAVLFKARTDRDPVPWVRIESPLSAWGQADLDLLSGCGGLGRVAVPKADEASLGRLGERVQDGHWLLIVETARGLWDLGRGRIVPPPGVTVRLAFGALDYALDLGLEPSGVEQAELLHARSEIVYLSRALGFGAPIDCVHPGFSDPAAVEAAARRGRALGFAGKLLIHPAQIAPVHTAFLPDAAGVAWARRVLAAVAEGQGAVQVDGAMVDRPVIERARAILAEVNKEGEGEPRC